MEVRRELKVVAKKKHKTIKLTSRSNSKGYEDGEGQRRAREGKSHVGPGNEREHSKEKQKGKKLNHNRRKRN